MTGTQQVSSLVCCPVLFPPSPWSRTGLLLLLGGHRPAAPQLMCPVCPQSCP